MDLNYEDRFWPDGIDLGAVAESDFPKGLFGTRWALEGNRYRSRVGATKPLADAIATTMNLLVLSERASRLVREDMKRAVHVDDEPAWAIQLPVLQNAIDTMGSSGVQAPEGQTLFWNTLAFRARNVTADVFWLQEEMPFSYVYITERFADRARAANLTGFQQMELVWDEGPRTLSYPPVHRIQDKNGYRYYLEIPFLLVRASHFGYMSQDINPILDEAMANGRLPTHYPSPR